LCDKILCKRQIHIANEKPVFDNQVYTFLNKNGEFSGLILAAAHSADVCSVPVFADSSTGAAV
jgi:hypothetical protein